MGRRKPAKVEPRQPEDLPDGPRTFIRCVGSQRSPRGMGCGFACHPSLLSPATTRGGVEKIRRTWLRSDQSRLSRVSAANRQLKKSFGDVLGWEILARGSAGPPQRKSGGITGRCSARPASIRRLRGDFSLYDHVLDAAFTFDAIPERFRGLVLARRSRSVFRHGARLAIRQADLQPWK